MFRWQYSHNLPSGGSVNAETETCLAKIGLFSCGLMPHYIARSQTDKLYQTNSSGSIHRAIEKEE